MNVAKMDKSLTVRDLNVPVRSLYLLARPGTCDRLAGLRHAKKRRCALVRDRAHLTAQTHSFATS